jgi:hypothetical protein
VQLSQGRRKVMATVVHRTARELTVLLETGACVGVER